VPHLAAGLDLRADHEAGRVDERDDRQAVGIAELHEAGGLVGRVGVDRAAEMRRVAGQDADRSPFDPGERGHRRRRRKPARSSIVEPRSTIASTIARTG
jgi:hypothetical protein